MTAPALLAHSLAWLPINLFIMMSFVSRRIDCLKWEAVAELNDGQVQWWCVLAQKCKFASYFLFDRSIFRIKKVYLNLRPKYEGIGRRKSAFCSFEKRRKKDVGKNPRRKSAHASNRSLLVLRRHLCANIGVKHSGIFSLKAIAASH